MAEGVGEEAAAQALRQGHEHVAAAPPGVRQQQLQPLQERVVHFVVRRLQCDRVAWSSGSGSIRGGGDDE